MPIMKMWNGTAWVELDAKDAKTLGGNLPSAFATSGHTHTAAQVGAVANVSGVPSMTAGLDASKPAAGTAGRVYIATDTRKIYRDNGTAWDSVGGSDTIDWSVITNKPATFAPSAHTHAISDVTNLQTTLNGKLDTGGKAADSDKLDGIDSSQFLRSDIAQNMNAKLNLNTTGGRLVLRVGVDQYAT